MDSRLIKCCFPFQHAQSFVTAKLHFDVESGDSAFHALRDLAEDISEDELRSDATVADGLIVKAEIPWLGGTREARKRLGGPVLLGTINIEDSKLIISVNSTKRAKKTKKKPQTKRMKRSARFHSSSNFLVRMKPFAYIVGYTEGGFARLPWQALLRRRILIRLTYFKS